MCDMITENERMNQFFTKFVELNEQNQKNVIAVQQALMFAQEYEKTIREKHCEGVP